MKISIGSDHRGYELKFALIKELSDISWLDVGCDSPERCDYPIYAQKVANDLSQNNAECGVLLCGSGVGVSIAANRCKGVYAALCWNAETARLAKEHDGANILVLPADHLEIAEAVAMVRAWLEAKFLGGRYAKRLEMIDAISCD